MSSSQEVVLYDLPSQQGVAWSLNPWKSAPINPNPQYNNTNTQKARMVLNYKKIPYTTEWVEYPDLEPKVSHFPTKENI
jgi:hypothetical protein